MSQSSSNHHAYYLNQLGIDVWVRRQEEAADEPLQQLKASVASCTRCPLHANRTHTVFARGNPHASVMVVGEAPGYYEDQQGLPFVGKAGRLLDKMLRSVGLSEEDVYIANVLKCRPPDNRDPTEAEIAACHQHLAEQITLVNPALLLAVGRFAGQFLIKQSLPLNRMRQHVHQYGNRPVIVSYHPAYLLRNPNDKKKAYADLLMLQQHVTSQACPPA